MQPLLQGTSFPGGSDGKESTCNEGNLASIPGSGKSPAEGTGYPLQCSYLENPMDRGAGRLYSPWGCKELNTSERLTLSSFQARSQESCA